MIGRAEAATRSVAPRWELVRNTAHWKSAHEPWVIAEALSEAGAGHHKVAHETSERRLLSMYERLNPRSLAKSIPKIARRKYEK